MSKKKSLIVFTIIAIIPFLAIVVVVSLILNSSSSSLLANKEDVMSYIERVFGDTNFEINERKNLNEKVCNHNGYSWSVKSNKAGVAFEIYETSIYNYGTGECKVSIIDTYEDKTPDVFYENEKLQSDNKYHYIFYPDDYNSKEELANKIYGLIDKYYLKKKLYAVRLIIKVGDTNVAVMPEDINSPEDIISNYLSE